MAYPHRRSIKRNQRRNDLNMNPEDSGSEGEIANHRREMRCASSAMLRGSIGFGLVSLLAFSVWAFGGRWLQAHSGEAGLYAVCVLVFVGFSGVLLRPLVRGPQSFLRFYAIFIPAFLAYGLVWCLAWFGLGFGIGEWLGSFLGSVAFVGVLSWRMRSTPGFIGASLVVFALNSAGYFLGGKLMHAILGPDASGWLRGLPKPGLLVAAKLAWGLLYGLGFGAGIGYAFHVVQKKRGGSGT